MNFFGLGSGLGFIYWKDKRMPTPFIGGTVKSLGDHLCENLNIKIETHKTSSPKKAWKIAKETMDNNEPLLISADMYYLEYSDVDMHFGGHYLVLVGYDEDNGVAYIADTGMDGLQCKKLQV
ncbi:MAG: BtrH N-terminal domain-containing protein [Methanosarcinales archaeon]